MGYGVAATAQSLRHKKEGRGKSVSGVAAHVLASLESRLRRASGVAAWFDWSERSRGVTATRGIAAHSAWPLGLRQPIVRRVSRGCGDHVANGGAARANQGGRGDPRIDCLELRRTLPSAHGVAANDDPTVQGMRPFPKGVAAGEGLVWSCGDRYRMHESRGESG